MKKYIITETPHFVSEKKLALFFPFMCCFSFLFFFCLNQHLPMQNRHEADTPETPNCKHAGRNQERLEEPCEICCNSYCFSGGQLISAPVEQGSLALRLIEPGAKYPVPIADNSVDGGHYQEKVGRDGFTSCDRLSSGLTVTWSIELNTCSACKRILILLDVSIYTVWHVNLLVSPLSLPKKNVCQA